MFNKNKNSICSNIFDIRKKHFLSINNNTICTTLIVKKTLFVQHHYLYISTLFVQQHLKKKHEHEHELKIAQLNIMNLKGPLHPPGNRGAESRQRAEPPPHPPGAAGSKAGRVRDPSSPGIAVRKCIQ